MRHNGYDSNAPQRTPNGCLTSMGYGSVRDGAHRRGQRPSTLDENDEMYSYIVTIPSCRFGGSKKQKVQIWRLEG